VGILLQRSLVVVLTAAGAIVTLWSFTGPLLVAVRQPHAVAHIAEGYMLRLVPGLVAMCGFEATRRFLQV
jgi:Na+-driven multidrug efflux pump